MKSIILFFVFIGFGTSVSIAQDFRYAQMNQHQWLINPASPGLIEGKGQLNMAYRARWSKVVIQRDMMIAYDHRLNDFSFGAGILKNDAGAASLKSTKLLLHASYKKELSIEGDFISLGLRFGLQQQRFNQGLFQFDNQYTEGSGYDDNASAGEFLLEPNREEPIINVGLMGGKYFDNTKIIFGCALNNINDSPFKNYNNDKEVVPTEITLFSKISMSWNDQLEGSFYLAYQKNKYQSEQVVGVQVNTALADENYLHLGLSHRLRNAIVVEAGYKLKNSYFTISYDIESNMLSKTTSLAGVFELSFRNDF